MIPQVLSVLEDIEADDLYLFVALEPYVAYPEHYSPEDFTDRGFGPISNLYFRFEVATYRRWAYGRAFAAVPSYVQSRRVRIDDEVIELVYPVDVPLRYGTLDPPGIPIISGLRYGIRRGLASTTPAAHSAGAVLVNVT